MKARVEDILAKIKQVKIAVYGEFCLDAYWILNPLGSEISVETGRQAEAVEKHYYSPGGAANVAANAAALEPKTVKAIGVIGNDLHGRELISQLQGLKVDTSALITQPQDFDTYTFTKRYLQEREISRTDFGICNQRTIESDQQLIESIQHALENYDAFIFNQQIPRSLNNPAFIQNANNLFKKFEDKVIVLDSRHYLPKFKYVSLKLNEIEVARLNGATISYQDHISNTEVERHGVEVFKKRKKPMYITCGNRGVVVVDKNGVHKIPGIQITSKIDPVGAGDTFLSALTLGLGAGYSPIQAAKFGNLAAGVSIQKLYTTGTASAEEIINLSRHAEYT